MDGEILKGVSKYHIKNSANGKAELRMDMVVKFPKEDTSESKLGDRKEHTMKEITDGIFPELLEIEIEKEPSVGAESSKTSKGFEVDDEHFSF